MVAQIVQKMARYESIFQERSESVLGVLCSLAAEDAMFSASFVRLGLSACDMGSSWLLPKLIGTTKATEMLLTGNLLPAKEAERLGLVNYVLQEPELSTKVQELARDMMQNSCQGLMTTKKILNSSMDGCSLRTAMTQENGHQMYLLSQPEISKQSKEWLDSLTKMRPKF